MSKEEETPDVIKRCIEYCWDRKFLDIFRKYFRDNAAAFIGYPPKRDMESAEHSLEHWTLFQVGAARDGFFRRRRGGGLQPHPRRAVRRLDVRACSVASRGWSCRMRRSSRLVVAWWFPAVVSAVPPVIYVT